jgi:hypothetical protein
MEILTYITCPYSFTSLCGNGTGAGLSHGTTMWRTTAIMETGTKLDLFPAKIPFYQEDRDTLKINVSVE